MPNIEYPEQGMFPGESADRSARRIKLEIDIADLEKRIAKNPFLRRAKRQLEQMKKELRELQMNEAGMVPGGIERR